MKVETGDLIINMSCGVVSLVIDSGRRIVLYNDPSELRNLGLGDVFDLDKDMEYRAGSSEILIASSEKVAKLLYERLKNEQET